ncbi:MAG: YbaB/EbfC family nucleoid-associated protein [Bacilli bacterium]|nr:YbaB/EbfC family nucleoid-associated protein [Bacilli bacterium]
MNMQAMLKQAQKLQKDMMKTQEEINAMTFTGKSSFVTVTVDGTKKLLDVKIDSEGLEKDEIEMLQDMIVVAINDAFKQVDKVTEEKMGPYTKGMPGLF